MQLLKINTNAAQPLWKNGRMHSMHFVNSVHFNNENTMQPLEKYVQHLKNVLRQ